MVQGWKEIGDPFVHFAARPLTMTMLSLHVYAVTVLLTSMQSCKRWQMLATTGERHRIPTVQSCQSSLDEETTRRGRGELSLFSHGSTRPVGVGAPNGGHAAGGGGCERQTARRLFLPPCQPCLGCLGLAQHPMANTHVLVCSDAAWHRPGDIHQVVTIMA
jgi:hypothetical protein